MVVKKEFAVLYKRIKQEDGSEEFVPIKIIEGTYNEIDHWFLDENDVAYSHMAEPTVSGICYANRMVIEAEESTFDDKLIEEIKKELTDLVNKVTLTRNLKEDYFISLKVKETGEEYILMDNDTDRLYEQYSNYYEAQDKEKEEYIRKIDITPGEIVAKVKETIKGQDEAIKKIVTSIWTTIKFENITKKNMLVIGPSGVGKTAIFKKLEQILDIPLTIFPVSGLSQAGYVGRSVDELLTQIYYDNQGNISKAEKAIVILDEIDKLANGAYSSGDVSTSGVQNELLKLIEGCKRVIQVGGAMGAEITIDTSKIIFVGIGAFSELHEKPKDKVVVGFGEAVTSVQTPKEITSESLITYGMKREMIGRLPVVINLNAMTKDILKDIILNSDESEFIGSIKALETMGVTINNISELIDLICEDALNKGIGARGLVSTITNIFESIFYEVANNPDKYTEVIIGHNIIKDNTDYQLIKKRVKKRVKEAINTESKKKG